MRNDSGFRAHVVRNCSIAPDLHRVSVILKDDFKEVVMTDKN